MLGNGAPVARLVGTAHNPDQYIPYMHAAAQVIVLNRDHVTHTRVQVKRNKYEIHFKLNQLKYYMYNQHVKLIDN